MRTGHKRQLAGGILGVMTGFGLILRSCLTGRWRVSLTALAVAAVSGGLLAVCDSLTAKPPDKGRNTQHEDLL